MLKLVTKALVALVPGELPAPALDRVPWLHREIAGLYERCGSTTARGLHGITSLVSASMAVLVRHISTKYVERQNLTLRMPVRRFTRLTNAFSQKVKNHAAASALHFMRYNFVRVHQMLKSTQAVASGASKPLLREVFQIELIRANVAGHGRENFGVLG